MTLKRKIFLKLGPKLTGRAVATLLAFALCFGTYKIFVAPYTSADTDSGEVEIESVGIEDSSNIDFTPYTVYDPSGALPITTPLSSQAAVLCSNGENKVIYCRAENTPISSEPIVGLAAALAVTDAFSKGETTPTERAVCPASAILLPCYDESSQIISVGESLTVAELVKAMLCTRPELFAYVLGIHIYGNEQSFVERINSVLHSLGATSTAFTSVGNAEKQTTTVIDAAIIFRAATEDPILFSLLSSHDSFTLSASGSAWDTVTLCGRFYSECCTEGQAIADGIICGYYGGYESEQYVYILFEQLGIKYVTVALMGTTAYADSLILLSHAGR